MIGSNLRSFLLLTLLASPVFASDHYVDPVNGNDANAGTSPASAWRTITWASGATYALGPQATIHLAPGVYAASSGESFPFQLHGQSLVGDQGRATTILQGSSRIFVSYYQQFGHAYSYSSEIRGVTLRGATDAAIACTYILHLVDVTIEGAGNAGIELGSSATGLTNDRNLDVSLIDVEIRGCPVGLLAGSGYLNSTIQNQVVLEGCNIHGQTQSGVVIGGSNTYAFSRCIIKGNAGHGIALDGGCGYTPSISVADCLIANNGADGIYLPSPCSSQVLMLDVKRSTIAFNSGRGLLVQGMWGSFHATFGSTILYGNAADWDVTLSGANNYATGTFGNIGDGHLAGSNGNIAVDPLFVDATNGDFRLRFGSPCIDTGDPGTPDGVLDLAGHARPIDGDLDTQERADMGAFEHAPLELVTSGHLGTPLRLEMWGPSGGTTTVFFSRHAPVSPTSTPFGQFDLDPASLGTFITSAVAPGPPVVFQRPITNNPVLVGRTFSFQARTSSSAAPQGFAYTNPVSVLIVP